MQCFHAALSPNLKWILSTLEVGFVLSELKDCFTERIMNEKLEVDCVTHVRGGVSFFKRNNFIYTTSRSRLL